MLGLILPLLLIFLCGYVIWRAGETFLEGSNYIGRNLRDGVKGATINEAIHSTLQEVGQAITFTTLILMSVFLFFIQVSHVGVSNFSILAVIAVFSALLADLFLLPALCRVLQIRV